jgi:hypothetical protein
MTLSAEWLSLAETGGTDMADLRFNLSYVGPDLATGRMDVRQLAPALLAVADLVHEANNVLYPGEPPPTVDIRATTQGSFVVDLALVEPHVIDQVMEVLRGKRDVVNSLNEILTLMLTALQTALMIEGRRIQRSEPDGDGDVALHLADGTSLTMPASRADLLEKPGFWRGAKSVAEPLGDGVTSLSVTAPGASDVEITADSKRFLNRPLLDPVVTEAEAQMVLVLRTISFAEGHKWRFSDGTVEFFADIADHEFMTRVMLGGDTFGAGDRLDCMVTTRQTTTADDKLATERTITRVIRHTPGPRQTEFSYPADDPE